jgi:hypothetical protein
MSSEAEFLVVGNPSVNELGATYTHRDIFIDLSRLLTARSQEGRTQLKIRPPENVNDTSRFIRMTIIGDVTT